ncbi:MAG: Uma2 family endonuclease [Gemmatimonadales bacterium]|jgi:hypothetical protein
MHVQIPTRRFTVEEYQRMAEAGILREDDRVELLDGRIVVMTPIGEPHAACVRRLNNLLAERAGGRAIIDVHREPGSEGYARIRTVTCGAEIEVAGLPGVTLTADEILG